MFGNKLFFLAQKIWNVRRKFYEKFYENFCDEFYEKRNEKQ